MREKYLGDSYDLVKRFFCHVLRPIAPLYAHPDFIHAGIREAYTVVTEIPVLGARPIGHFGILLDPDTGIPLPGRLSSSRHASLESIVDLSRNSKPTYILCFDQSYHRKHEKDRKGQRHAKMSFLQEQGLKCLYYVSHAPFLFSTQESLILNNITERLVRAGIPKCRLETP